MDKSSTSVVLLIALALFATGSLADQPCPSKCLQPKSKAVLQCGKGARRNLCAVKQCPDGRGWKCTKTTQSKGKCTPVTDGPRCSSEPLLCTLEDLEEILDDILNRRSRIEIGCRCQSETSFSSKDKIVVRSTSKRQTRCYLNCMKTAACRRGACTAESASGDALDQCSEKRRLFSQNVRSRRFQRKCCEGCGLKYILGTKPGSNECRGGEIS